MPEPEVAGSTDLELAGLTKRYGDFTAVDALDLTVPAGSFFALLGPSGCGKTTTLRMIAGLEVPTAGSVTLAGDDITRLKPYRRPVNTVFQSYALFPHLTVRDNVAFGPRRKGASKREAADDVGRMLDLVELAEYAARKPAQLSGGQQQRVALARALINSPQVLLLDEPLGALDLKLRRQMQVELKRIQIDVGLTFIHVTHDQEEAMTMADTVAVMNHGRIEQMGAPEELYDLPRTTFVANFLGRSNLVPGSVTRTSGGNVEVQVDGASVTAPAERAVSGEGKVWVGVRPEKVQLRAPDETGAAANHLRGGVVSDVSFVGVSTEYLVRMPWGQELTVFEQNHTSSRRLRTGDEVDLSWAPEHTFLLDAAQDATAGTQIDDE
ncbi:ABC transporter ATP-binding protein [Nocardioides bizhenqiangii]|uniref:Spermidine/putrescine import ATP-binding protein PotA n=1 Tax=Nocardioides bizhenqiangii TaxID=3095076 RepID=A0ABZ0ZQY2_9ACTN|nr:MULTISPECIES: ABC transporter ATP-binding protein [unclassified Nocardioides]MDZ5619658.1 ABC transporter ATP-binding protein [Nocardioides sp. HM23]WQQ26331.1 ABC transporter ATP-binding protein [Nocardioides sp. HM61]